jgi:sulfite reductase (NADPH) hemoprotein beta-component
LPGGVCTPRQWLASTHRAPRHERHAAHYHAASPSSGVITPSSRQPWLPQRNAVDTIAACGDVNRNVLASANPVESRAHAAAYEWARKLSEHLLPHTRAYHEIWLDGEKVAGTEEVEPIYGPTYLPRKFKAAIAVPPVNDVDLFAQDLGFIAIVEHGELQGFNLAVGGGLGASHGDATTYPRLADVVGFLRPEQLLAVAEAVVTTQRDFGNREVRKHARLKYTIDARGLDWFVAEITASPASVLRSRPGSADGRPLRLARGSRRALAPHAAHRGGAGCRYRRVQATHGTAGDRQGAPR